MAEQLQKLADAAPDTETIRRVVDDTLVGHWERAYRNRRPNPTYMRFLIQIFKDDLKNPQTAIAWAALAGHTFTPETLREIFPLPAFIRPLPPALKFIKQRSFDLPSHKLFGLKQRSADLTQALLNQEDDWIINLVGLGGLGKTSLATQVVMPCLRPF